MVDQNSQISSNLNYHWNQRGSNLIFSNPKSTALPSELTHLYCKDIFTTLDFWIGDQYLRKRSQGFQIGKSSKLMFFT